MNVFRCEVGMAYNKDLNAEGFAIYLQRLDMVTGSPAGDSRFSIMSPEDAELIGSRLIEAAGFWRQRRLQGPLRVENKVTEARPAGVVTECGR